MKSGRGILDVARKAGVSSATVSRVLTGNAYVSEAMKKKVLEAVKELDFHPNQMAQGLRTGRSRTIALLVGDIEQGIYPALTRYIQEALEEANYELLFYNLGHRHERLEKILEKAVAMKIGGVILATSDLLDTKRLNPLIAKLRERGVFTLSVGQSLQHLGIPSIIHDEQAAVEASVAYLTELYGGSIAFLGRIGDSVLGGLRFEGYKAGLRHLGLELNPDLVWDTSRRSESGYRFVAGKKRVLKQLKDVPFFRSIQASSDELALGAISAILESGLRIPEDIAVVGVGDVEWSAHVQPALTTLGGRTRWVADKVIELVHSAELGEPSPSSIVFDRLLIKRASA